MTKNTTIIVDGVRYVRHDTTKMRTIPRMTPPQLERFNSHIEKAGPDDCWNWKSADGSFGHGRFKLNGVLYLPHRVAYSQAFGSVPRNLVVMHKCDNPKCCNPAHLVAGSKRENVQDMIAKGRQYKPPTGMDHPASIMRPEMVKVVCESPLSERAIADEIGISKSLAHLIRKRYRGSKLEQLSKLGSEKSQNPDSRFA